MSTLPVLKHKVIEFSSIVAPKLLNGILLLMSNLILLQHLSPSEFGLYSLVVTTIIYLDAVIGSSFDMGIIKLASENREKFPQKAHNIERVGLFNKLILISCFYLSTILLINLYDYVFKTSNFSVYIHLIFIIITAMLIYRSTLIYFQLRSHFGLYGGSEGIQLSGKYTGILITLFLGVTNSLALLVWYLIGPVIAVLKNLYHIRFFFFKKVGQYKKLSQELRHYVFWFFITASIGTLLAKIDLFIIAKYMHMDDVGIFSSAYNLAIIPELFGSYIAILLSPRIMPYLKQGCFYQRYKKIQFFLYITAILGFVILYWFISLDFLYFLPQDYQQAPELISILLIGSFAGFITFPITLTFMMFNKPKFIILIDIISLPLLSLCYYYALKSHGLMGVAWVTALSHTIRAIIIQAYSFTLARKLDNSIA